MAAAIPTSLFLNQSFTVLWPLLERDSDGISRAPVTIAPDTVAIELTDPASVATVYTFGVDDEVQEFQNPDIYRTSINLDSTGTWLWKFKAEWTPAASAGNVIKEGQIEVINNNNVGI